MPLKFDYNLYSDRERVNYIGTQDLSTATNAQLEQAATYILYGKDTSHTNAIQQKRLLKPKSRYSTYENKCATSLEELQSQPNYVERENSYQPYNTKNTYVSPRPSISRENDADIPIIQSLWDSIDTMERKIKVGEHKVAPATEAEENWAANCTSLQLYQLRHWLIDLRKHQYYLKEHYKPTIPPHHSFAAHSAPNWESNATYYRLVQCPTVALQLLRSSDTPDALRARGTQALLLQAEQSSTENLGSVSSNQSEGARHTDSSLLWDFLREGGENHKEDKWWEYITYGGIQFRRERHMASPPVEWLYTVKEHMLDFTNPDHIFQIFQHYSSLRESSWDDLNGQMKYILMAFDELQEKANLSPIQQHILDREVLHYTNDRICAELKEKFGVSYNRDYISSLYRSICAKIARTAAIEQKKFEWKDDPTKWKICSCCGERLLATIDFFVKKSENRDGLAGRCKKCDKAARDKKKVMAHG